MEIKVEKIKELNNNVILLSVKGMYPKESIEEQVKENNFVPNAAQMKETTQRLYSYFGVNEAIVQNKYDEDGWNAFYESEIEPIRKVSF